MAKQKTSSLFWPAVSAILAVVLVITLMRGSASASKEEVSLKAQEFVQSYLVPEGTSVSIRNVTEESGLYKLSIVVVNSGREIVVPSYATKDGKLLFPQAIDLTIVPEEQEAAQPEQSAEKVQQAATPKVQLFVMSQCPYGVQAENAIKPVLDALKNKISFELRFIANSDGKGGFSSLHGQAEVDEDIRQVCAAKYYPASYMDYVICRNKNIRSSDWQACATEAKMDSTKIKTCFEGAEGKTLLAENIKAANELGVGSSPTILINSQAYRGQRTPQDFLGGICSAFLEAPAECSEALGANATASDMPTGGCGA